MTTVTLTTKGKPMDEDLEAAVAELIVALPLPPIRLDADSGMTSSWLELVDQLCDGLSDREKLTALAFASAVIYATHRMHCLGGDDPQGFMQATLATLESAKLNQDFGTVVGDQFDDEV